MNAQAPVRTVAVVGGGLVAHLAALAIARGVPGARVALLTPPVERGALADRFPATLPASEAVLRRLGLDPEALVAGGAASPRAGEAFADWGSEAAAWTQSFGPPAPLGLAGAPHQLWLAAPAPRPPLSALFPASALAERGMVPAEPTLRLSPARLLPALRDLAARSGVTVRAGALAGVDLAADGRCAGVRLAGERVAADLFVDATGPSAALAQALGARRCDWSATLPVDRLLVAPRPGARDPVDRYTANDLGWRAAFSTLDGEMAAVGYAHAPGQDARARRLLAPADGAELIAVAPGRLTEPWTANVVALGDAACAPGPLGSAGFALALLHLELLLALWPAAPPDPLLVAEYNRRAVAAAERIHDWVAAPYLVHPRPRGGLWRALARVAPPDGLAQTLAQFAQRGQVPHREEDSLTRDDWAQRLIGLGVRPARRDPVALSTPTEALRQAIARAAAAAAARG